MLFSFRAPPMRRNKGATMPTDTTTAPMMIDFARLCAELCIGITTGKKLMKCGKLPLKKFRLCRKLLFSRDELVNWVSAGMPASARWSQLREMAAFRKTG
jgi:hypothetical protein